MTSLGSARRGRSELPARFAALRKALAPLPIASAASNGKPNVILTAFPKVEFNQKAGRLCGETRPRERLDGLNVGGVLVDRRADSCGW